MNEKKSSLIRFEMQWGGLFSFIWLLPINIIIVALYIYAYVLYICGGYGVQLTSNDEIYTHNCTHKHTLIDLIHFGKEK